MIIISTPVILVNTSPFTQFDFLGVLGLILWLIGFIFEAVGDYQLGKFIHNTSNKGKVCNIGLWRYSRHPNYFGEITQWWAIFLITLASPTGFWGIIGPVAISFLILKISGIPPQEKGHLTDPEYIEYRKHTSIFFPLPYKK